MTYRAAYRTKLSGEKVVYCIGYDEGQSGNYEEGIPWCTFTFEEIPEISEVVEEIVNDHEDNLPLCFKVVDNTIVLREAEDILSDYE